MNRSTLEAEYIYSELSSDEDLGELVEIFVSEIPNRVSALTAGAETSNWEELTRLAHQLKGAAGSYGFHQMTPVAAHLESICRNRHPEEEILAALDDLVNLCGKIRAGAPQ